MNKQHLIIIGSGLAGYMAAKEWRKLDQQSALTIITQSSGAFYSKPLLSTALTQGKTADQLVVSDANAMAQELKATILTHTKVLAIDAEQQQVVLTEQRLNYSQLILACGADMVQVPLIGDAIADVCAVNDLDAYAQFRQWLTGKQHIAILGTGLVGCEFANDLLNANYQVTMISPEAYPLVSFLPAQLGKELQAIFARQGANWHLNRFAIAVQSSDRGYQISLDTGENIYADGVFAAVGLRPHLQLAKSAGLLVNEGIVVDRWLRTSKSNIYALGDCAEIAGIVKQYVAPILQCARALAKILTGGNEPVHYPVMPIVIKTPLCPLVVYPPAKDIIGEWHIEGESPHFQALFYDHAGQLHGYALVGNKVRDKLTLAEKLPLVFS